MNLLSLLFMLLSIQLLLLLFKLYSKLKTLKSAFLFYSYARVTPSAFLCPLGSIRVKTKPTPDKSIRLEKHGA